MTIVKATLAKHQTDDGLCEFKRTVPLGTEYLVDLDTRRRERLFNVDLLVAHEKEIINVVGGEGWLPTECLRLQVN